MENNQQQLSPETYQSIIQELTTTIGNLHLELALARTHYKEVIEYAQNLQNRIDEMSQPVEKVSAEIVGEGSHE